MDFFQSPNPKNPSKRNKKRLTQDQVRLLENSFNYNKKLEHNRKIELAIELGLPPRQVAVWYQNKRARWKAQSLELDYKSLQVRLDSVLAEKRWLEKEVGRLRGELEKAQDMLLAMKPPLPPVSSVSISCDEEGSPSLPGNGNYCWDNAGVLQVEEFYACLMNTEGQTAKLNGQDLFVQSIS